MTLGVACGKLWAMIARPHDSDAPSLGLVLVKALVFWLRHQGVFWLVALPIAGLAAAVTYVLEANQALVDWRHHWGWDVLGGFKWSSQHFDGGGCDEPSKATFGSVWTDAIVFPRSTASGRTR
jgi:hypothetical protein